MAACEGSHFFIRYAEVWVSLTDLCAVADFYHRFSRIFVASMWSSHRFHRLLRGGVCVLLSG